MQKSKVIRTSTIALSLNILLKGQLYFLKKYYDVIAVSGENEDLRVVENREGVKTQDITMQRQIEPFKDSISLIKLYFYFKKEKPQIVHSITPKAGLLSMVAAYLARVPIRIHTFTGLIFPTRSGVMKRLLIVMDKILCSCATHIYPEGEGVKKDLINFNITKKSLKILANGNVNGIDTNYFNPTNFSEGQSNDLRQQLNIYINDLVFIFVGRLVGDKGINELVAAFKKLQANNHKRNSKLLLVGPLETDLDPLKRETLEEIENSSTIISVGYQPDIRPYLNIANVLVFPSYREGFPNVVMQAGAMGLPSIVTNINGCNEIIKEGENGWIIPVKSTDAIFNNMQNCLINQQQVLEMVSISREMITSRYEQKMVWEALLAEYKILEELMKIKRH
jgi:glycosyltransferase involved in cell wall biosynthesis